MWKKNDGYDDPDDICNLRLEVRYRNGGTATGFARDWDINWQWRGTDWEGGPWNVVAWRVAARERDQRSTPADGLMVFII